MRVCVASPEQLERRYKIPTVQMNDDIQVPELRVINPEGVQIGIIPTTRAKQLAADVDLDLIVISPDANPPVAKILDYNKYRYELELKTKENKRNQKNADMKEMRFRLKVDENDFNIKVGKIIDFLKAGDKVKVQIMFRGREQQHPEMGIHLLEKVAEIVAEVGVVTSAPVAEGRNAVMLLNPLVKKEKTVSEQRRRGEETKNSRAERQAKRLAAKGLGTDGKPLKG